MLTYRIEPHARKQPRSHTQPHEYLLHAHTHSSTHNTPNFTYIPHMLPLFPDALKSLTNTLVQTTFSSHTPPKCKHTLSGLGLGHSQALTQAVSHTQTLRIPATIETVSPSTLQTLSTHTQNSHELKEVRYFYGKARRGHSSADAATLRCVHAVCMPLSTACMPLSTACMPLYTACMPLSTVCMPLSCHSPLCACHSPLRACHFPLRACHFPLRACHFPPHACHFPLRACLCACNSPIANTTHTVKTAHRSQNTHRTNSECSNSDRAQATTEVYYQYAWYCMMTDATSRPATLDTIAGI